MINDEGAEEQEPVLTTFDTLFNKRDYAAAKLYWSETYIQHSVP
jgi:hypothetical protein